MAFRPSWAPLEPELPPPAARSSAPGEAAGAAEGREDEPRDLQEPLRLPVRGARRRASLLTGASVLSFLGLLYWGISSTTHPAAPVHVLQNGRRGLDGNGPARPASEPDRTEIAAPAPGAIATDLSALRARPELVEPSRARLADPDPPPAAPVEPEATPAELEKDGTERTQLAAAAPAPTVESATAAPSADQPAAPAEASTTSAPTASATPAAIPSAQHPQSTASAPSPAAAVSDAPAPAVSAAAAIPAAQPPENTAIAPSPTRSAAPVPAAPAPAAAAPLTAAAKPGTAHQEPIATAARAPAEPAPQRKRMPLLSVRALPEGARLFLDGQRLPNPFDMRLPEGGKHKLEARYEGYESSTQNFRIEADAKLTITLRRTPTEPQLQVRPIGQQPAQQPQGAGFVTSNPY